MATPYVPADELRQVGMIGLWRASTHYDGMKGASFKTYASKVAHWAMQNEVRAQTHLRDGLPDKEYEGRCELLNAVDVEDVSLESNADVFDAVLIEELHDAIDRLPWPHSYVMAEHSIKGRTLVSVGDALGLTKGRICQLVGEGTKLLRQKMT